MNCRLCGTLVVEFLSLGELPLGNAFLRSPQEFDQEPRFPLTLGFCPTCTLVQQMAPPPVALLEADYRQYRYVPVGESLRGHLAALGREVAEGLEPGGLVVDLGSNDGALLAAIKDRCRVLGVEPAEEISERARQAGVPTLTSFFDEELARIIVATDGPADVVTCTQTLQHIPDLSGFLAGVRTLLAPNGVFVVEGRYFPATMRQCTYDTIYHEMLVYFSLHSLKALLERHGLVVFKTHPTTTYGGSLRVYAGFHGEPDISVADTLLYERASGVRDINSYRQFANDVHEMSLGLRDLVKGLKAKGARIAGYGAPSTSTTLLGFCGIGAETIDYILDDNPLKQGLFHPGTHIPIVSAQALEQKPPTHLLILAHQFENLIMEHTKLLGAKYILPVPPRIVDG